MAGTSREEEKTATATATATAEEIATAEEMGAAAAAAEKSDSSDEGEEMEEDVESDSDDSPGSKRMKMEGYIPYPDLLGYYTRLDFYLAHQDESGPNFTDNYSSWSEEPDTDRRYIAFYDKLMATPNFFSLVGEERDIMGQDSPSLCKAKEVADNDDRFCYLDEDSMLCCLDDMLREHVLEKELVKLKEYENCLLNSKYWKDGESASVELKDYQQYTGHWCAGFSLADAKHWCAGFSLADAKKDFESWIFKLGSSSTEDELHKRVLDDHANRLKISEGFMQTRARYIKKKLEFCRIAGIDFERSFRETGRQIEKTMSLGADS